MSNTEEKKNTVDTGVPVALGGSKVVAEGMNTPSSGKEEAFIAQRSSGQATGQKIASTVEVTSAPSEASCTEKASSSAVKLVSSGNPMADLKLCSLCKNESSTIALWRLWEDRAGLAIGSKLGPNNVLTGYSWAALRTNFNVGRLMFDAGLSTNVASDYIFLTHGHSDHSASLYFHTLSENKKTIFLPAEIRDQAEALLKSTFAFSDFGTEFDPDMAKWTLQPCVGGQEYDTDPYGEKIKHNGTNHKVKVYKNDHGVPCVSYGFLEEKKAIKQEYEHLIRDGRGKELGLLRKGNPKAQPPIPPVEVDEIRYEPRFIYVGDTSEDVFSMNPEIFQYPDIIVECTFLGINEVAEGDDLKQADKTKHCHWERLRPLIQANRNCRFILYHFSQRYKARDIEAFFKDPKNQEPNVVAWVNT